MTVNEVYTAIKDFKASLETLQGIILTYEASVDGKAAELRSLDSKIASKRQENESAMSKASLVLAKASEEAAQVRRQAQEILDSARTESVRVKAEKDEALKAIAEAKARSMKLEADEKAFNANVTIFERKKQAIESALHVG